MSGGAIAAVAAVSAAASIYSANQQRKAAQKSAEMQQQASDRQLAQQQQQFNQANRRQTNLESVYAAEQNSGQGNMLSGSLGVLQDDMQLGSGTTLGGG